MRHICLLLLAACSTPSDLETGVTSLAETPVTPQVDSVPAAASTLTPCAAPLHDAGAGVVVSDASPDVATGATPRKPRVFVYGNSLVYGPTASNILATSFPARLRDRLGPDWEASDWRGRGGWSTSQLYWAAPHDLPQFLDKDRTRNVLVFTEGLNDLNNAYACEAYEGMARARISEGWTVVLMTTTPTSYFTNITPDGGPGLGGPKRDAFNACVRAGWRSWGVTAIVNIDLDPMLQDPFGPMWSSDHVHPSDPGYERIAADVETVVRGLYVAP